MDYFENYSNATPAEPHLLVMLFGLVALIIFCEFFEYLKNKK